jgi:hypothetical protein
MLGKDAADPVEAGKIDDGPDAHAVPKLAVPQTDTTDVSRETEEGEFGDFLLGVRAATKRGHLDEVATRAEDRTAVAVERHLAVAGRIDDLRVRQTLVTDAAQELVKIVEARFPADTRGNGRGFLEDRGRSHRRGVGHALDAPEGPEHSRPESPSGEEKEPGAEDGMTRAFDGTRRGRTQGHAPRRRPWRSTRWTTAGAGDRSLLHIRSGAETPMRPSPWRNTAPTPAASARRGERRSSPASSTGL